MREKNPITHEEKLAYLPGSLRTGWAAADAAMASMSTSQPAATARTYDLHTRPASVDSAEFVQ